MPMADTFRILPIYIRFHRNQIKAMESTGRVDLKYIGAHCQSYPVFVCLFCHQIQTLVLNFLMGSVY